MNLAELSEKFLKHEVTIGHSRSTVTQRRSHLRKMLWHLEKIGVGKPHELLREHIEGFIEELTWTPARSRLFPLSVRSRNSILCSVKGFCRWLYEQNYAAADVSDLVRYAREPETLPRNVPSEEQVQNLLAAPDGQTLLGFRDRTIMEVLYATGLRVGELVALDLADVDLEMRFVRVRYGKGGKERVVPLGERAAAGLQSYINGVRPLLANDEENALLLSKSGQRLGTKGVQVVMAAYARAAGLPHMTPHMLRHACATHMLRRGAQIRHLQELLGHSDVTTTEIYTRLTNLELIEAHRQFHPREQGEHMKSDT